MRVNAELLSEALDQVQAAIFEPSLWLPAIEAISKASGALGATIAEPNGRGVFGATLSTENLEVFLEGYVREDWGSRDFRVQKLLPAVRRAGVVLETDLISKEQFERHDYYKFMRKHGIADCVLLDLSSAKDELYLVFQNRLAEAPLPAQDAAHFHAIRARLISALQLAQHVDASKVVGMAAAFETSHIGCIFFDRKGLVTLANAKAEALFTGDLRISRGEVRVSSAIEAAHFNRALKTVLQAQRATTDTVSVVRLSRPGKRPLVVRFERLGAQLTDVFSHSCAMALIEDPDEEIRQNPETLMTLFDLTPAETRISLLVAAGMSAVDIASQYGIGYETVRSHIRSIFQKTGTGRQSELSALFGKIHL